jgi:hypothetical protein
MSEALGLNLPEFLLSPSHVYIVVYFDILEQGYASFQQRGNIVFMGIYCVAFHNQVSQSVIINTYVIIPYLELSYPSTVCSISLNKQFGIES